MLQQPLLQERGKARDAFPTSNKAGDGMINHADGRSECTSCRSRGERRSGRSTYLTQQHIEFLVQLIQVIRVLVDKSEDCIHFHDGVVSRVHEVQVQVGPGVREWDERLGSEKSAITCIETAILSLASDTETSALSLQSKQVCCLLPSLSLTSSLFLSLSLSRLSSP